MVGIKFDTFGHWVPCREKCNFSPRKYIIGREKLQKGIKFDTVENPNVQKLVSNLIPFGLQCNFSLPILYLGGEKLHFFDHFRVSNLIPPVLQFLFSYLSDTFLNFSLFRWGIFAAYSIYRW